jgi:hypothetical protein
MGRRRSSDFTTEGFYTAASCALDIDWCLHDGMQVPMRPCSKNPPAWDTHLFGPAYGNCNRFSSPKPKNRNAASHCGNGALFPITREPPKQAETPPYRKDVLSSQLDVNKLEDVRSPQHASFNSDAYSRTGNDSITASVFWGKQIRQIWACIPKKYVKRANNLRSKSMKW